MNVYIGCPSAITVTSVLSAIETLSPSLDKDKRHISTIDFTLAVSTHDFPWVTGVAEATMCRLTILDTPTPCAWALYVEQRDNKWNIIRSAIVFNAGC